MERYKDCVELLKDVGRNIEKLREQYEIARTDENIKFTLRPLVKTTLEHLRSVLEYSAQDIWRFYNTNNKRLYFPFGKDEVLFNESVKKNLPNLQQHQALYELVESLQPHSSGDSWLIELCDQTNFNKHNSLSKQIRRNSAQSTTVVGDLVKMSGRGTVIFNDCVYKGKPFGKGKPSVISGAMTVDEIKKSIGLPIPIKREFDWVEFCFENSAQDTLKLIGKAYENISSYIDKLRIELR